jgi:hypothetical protein
MAVGLTTNGRLNYLSAHPELGRSVLKNGAKPSIAHFEAVTQSILRLGISMIL